MIKRDNDDGIEWVYTKKIRLRDGRVIYASSYGLKAFRFPKPEPKRNTKKEDSSHAEAA